MVSGKVTYQGKPLPVGSVTFFGGNNQIVGSAAIENGTYKIDKVPAGPVKITVTVPPIGPLPPSGRGLRSPSGKAPVPIPSKYGSPENSGLTYEVKPGTQEHPINLD